ncbi:MAG: hypothetical protein ABW211_02570, partial [Acidimicrobiia bacterium]
MRRVRRVTVAITALVTIAAVAVGCGGGDRGATLGKKVTTTTTPVATTMAPPSWQSTIATAKVPTLDVF